MSCLLYFGEANTPSSRAFWDDCDVEENPIEVNKLDFLYEDDYADNEPVDMLLVVEGSQIEDFVKKSFLQDAKKICSLSNKLVALYYLKTQKVMLTVIEEDLTHSGEILKLLLPYVTAAREVITLNIKPKVEYKSANILQTREKITFICKISGNLETIQQLQSPNFISGVSAGISSWLYNERDVVNSYVAYTDMLPLDGLAAKPILQIIQQLGIQSPKTYNPTMTKTSQLYL